MSNIKKESKLKTGQLIALLAIAAVNILWLVCTFVSLPDTITVKTCIPILMILITAIYAVYGYQKPHGNHMRYLLLIHAVYAGILLVANQSTQSVYVGAVNVAVIILSTYMAGRLDKYKQNLVICAVILVLQFVNIYPFMSSAIRENAMSFVTFFKYVGPVSIWLAIAASYIFRFKPHKEAGLADQK